MLLVLLNGWELCEVSGARHDHTGGSCRAPLSRLLPKLQKRAFSAYEHKHWILMRAERAGALPGHARSALAGHRTRGAR